LQHYRPFRALLAKGLWHDEIVTRKHEVKEGAGLSDEASCQLTNNPKCGKLEDLSSWATNDHRRCRLCHCPQEILRFQTRQCVTWRCYLCKRTTAQHWLSGSTRYTGDRIMKYVHNDVRSASESVWTQGNKDVEYTTTTTMSKSQAAARESRAHEGSILSPSMLDTGEEHQCRYDCWKVPI
jgi:hypothetical protein